MNKKSKKKNKRKGKIKKCNINEELAQILISTGQFSKDTLKLGQGAADVIIEDHWHHKWYFEIKQSSWPKGRFFDAATLTQWHTWYHNQERFYFVFITGKKTKRLISFVKAEDLMNYSNIPPFKIYFTLYKDQIEDNFAEPSQFAKQVQILVGEQNVDIVPSLKQHQCKRTTSYVQLETEPAIRLTNVSIDDLNDMYNSLRTGLQ